MPSDGTSLVDRDGAEKEVSLLTFPRPLCGRFCVFFTEELRHARLPYGIVDDLMSGLSRALCNLAHLWGHSIQPTLVETKELLSEPGERR